MTITSTPVRTRLAATVVSFLLLVGAQLLLAAPTAHAAQGVTITGTVVDSVTAKGLPGATVADTAGTATTTTHDDGTYELTVAPGDHVLSATVTGYVPGVSTTLSGLVDGSTVSGVTITLQKYASASGTVLGSTPETRVSGVAVKLFTAGSSSPNADYSATTAADGSWTIPSIVPGSYKLEYDAAGSGYMTQWHDGQATRDAATLLTVVPGAAIALSAQLVQQSTISGTVTAGSSPVAGATVHATREDGTDVTSTLTDATGKYTLTQLSADTYLVYVDASGYARAWYGNAAHRSGASTIALSESQNLVGRNIALQASGSIAGTISPAPGSAVAWVVASSGGDAYAGTVHSDGTYTVADLPAGSYTVQMAMSGYYSSTYPSPVPVTANAQTAGIDATLVPGTTTAPNQVVVSGRVVDLSGNGLGGVTVSGVAATTTAPDGTYTVVGLTSTSLTYFRDGYITAYRNVHDGAAAYTEDDVQMSRVVTISGTVTAGSPSAPLAGASVRVYSGGGAWVATATTKADGSYSVTGLAEGYYAVAAVSLNDASYGTSFYGGASSLTLATYIPSREGSALTGVDVHLAAVGSIGGTVSWDGGSAAGATVTATTVGFSRSVTLDSTGTFSIGSLPAGSYRVSAYLSEWGQAWYNGAASEAAATLVPVGDGSAVTGIAISLQTGHTLSGVVTSDSAVLQAGAQVSLVGSDGQVSSTATDSNGVYTFRGLPTGSYGLGVLSSSRVLWLPGTTTAAHAARFFVDSDAPHNITVPAARAVTVTVSDTSASGSVSAYDQFGEYADSANLDAGSAALSLLDGTYTLKTVIDGYVSDTRQVTVTGATTVTIALSSGGTLAGQVEGVTGASVIARQVATGEAFRTDIDAESHRFTLGGLPNGTYVVGITPQNDLGACGPFQWFNGTSSYVAATRVAVTNGHLTDLGTVTLSCTAAQPTYRLSGHLTLPDGMALTDTTRTQVNIGVVDTATATYLDSTFPAADGSFSFDLPSGTYVVTVNATSLNLAQATKVVTVNDADASAEVVMGRAGTVTGSVVDAFGHQTAVSVSVASATGSGNSTYAANGVFSLSGLEAGTYTVTIAPRSVYATVTVSPVTVTLAHTTDLGTITLRTTGRIVGTLPQGLYRASSVTIDATDAYGTVLASTLVTQGGDWVLSNVPAGPVYLRFSGGVETEWWQDSATLAGATPVTVVANQAVSGIEPELTVPTVRYVTISGTVTGPDGPVADVSLFAQGSSGTASATTDAAGRYSLSVPENGTYELNLNVCLGYASGEIAICTGDSYSDTRTVTVGSADQTVDWSIGSLSDFTTAPVPTISGDAVVGATLTADAGAWSPTPDSVTYQWYADSVPIDGATGTTLALTDAQRGKVVTVQVTATKTGFVTASRTSVATPAVSQATLTPGTVTVTGTPQVGVPLTATTANWPAGATLSYQWYRGAQTLTTGPTYTPTASDVGMTLSVEVTATPGTYVPASASATTAPVVKGVLTKGTVAVGGTAAVGQTLTAAVSGWPQNATTSLQWLRNGTAIAGAAASAYGLVAADLGATISVRVTATQTGYEDASLDSSSTAAVVAGVLPAATVTISGAPTVGLTTTASVTGWPTGTQVTWTWQRGSQTVATGASYVPTADDLGATLTAVASGSMTGYATATASTSTAVSAGTITPGTVTVTGGLALGSTLTAAPGTWAPATTTVSYQWLRDGTAIGGATAGVYVSTVADVGHVLSVVATGTLRGYTTATTTALAGTVLPGTLQAGTVTIPGTPAVGAQITATTAGWPADATVTYQWSRGGTTLTGATALTYTPVPADAGATLTLTVTATRDGYTTVSRATTSAAVLPGAITTGPVTVSGTAVVGSTLTAVTTGWAPSTVTLRYQWLRDGVAVAGATSATYVPVLADVAHALSVTVTGSATGYTTASVTSAATGRVPALTMTGSVAVTGTATVGSTLAAVPTWTPASAALTYQWLRDGAAITGATGATYTLASADLGARISVTATGTATGYTTASATSAQTVAVTQLAVTPGTVTITGTPAVGSTLTANAGTWSPTGVTFTYQWRRNGTAIAGATSATYAPVAADLGATLTVAVTGARTGYTSATAVSAATTAVTQRAVTAGTVTISGAAVVGSRLTANPGSWSPGRVNLAYQWLRDGVAIGGATGTRYTVTVDDVAHRLTVAVTGSRNGYGSATAVSAPTASVPKPTVTAGKAAITGTPMVTSTLTATSGSWSPSDVTLTYQWRRDGVAVARATAATYKLVAADAGHAMTVAITGSRAGYTSATAVSAATARVRTAAAVYGTFATDVYGDLLGRAPTAAELAAAATALANGTSRADYLASLVSTDAWRSATVTSAYTSILGRSPSASELASGVSALRSGRMSVADLQVSLYTSAGYYHNQGGTVTAWVTGLYSDILGRAPDAGGLAYYVRLANDPRYGRSYVALSILSSDESRRLRVQALYEKILLREPTAREWQTWTARLQSTSDVTLALALTSSDEYWSLAFDKG